MEEFMVPERKYVFFFLGSPLIPGTIDPFPNTSAPARLHLPVPHVSTKPLKSSLSLHAKILFYIWNNFSKLSTTKGIIMK